MPLEVIADQLAVGDQQLRHLVVGPGEADLARHQWHGIEPAVRQEGFVVAEALHGLPCEAELVGVGTQAVHQRHGVATVDRTVQVHGIAAAIPDHGAVRTHHPVDGGAAGQLVDRGALTPAGRSDHNDARLVRSGDGGAGPVAHLAVGAEEGPVEVGCDHRREHLHGWGEYSRALRSVARRCRCRPHGLRRRVTAATIPAMTDSETTLLLVRHGESVVTVRGVMGGEKSCEGPVRPRSAAGRSAA